MAFLRTKREFSKEQLALAMEVWNTNPDPDCFVFRVGDRTEAQAAQVTNFDAAGAEHIFFRPRPAQVVAAAPAPKPPTMSHKKKKK